MGVVDELRRAREAYERREWVSAFRSLSELEDTGGALRLDDFLALATTAYLLGRRNDCVLALQRAYRTALDGGDVPGAVGAAGQLALVLATGGEPAVAGGWVARGERLLERVPDDVPQRGRLLVLHMFRRLDGGDRDGALDLARQVADCGRRHGDADLVAVGLNAEGRILTDLGDVAGGVRLMDEAMVGVVAGEVSPVIAGIVYCSMIEGCTWIADYGRATEWTHALTQWCSEQPGLVAFTGQCAVHRGQLLRLHGAFPAALAELELAERRYAEEGAGPAVTLARHERADVLRILGEYERAEQVYDEAARSGDVVPPGRALLWLATGRVEDAAGAVRQQVAEVPDQASGFRVLPAAVEVLASAGALDEAAALAAELQSLAVVLGSPAAHGVARLASAQVALARGDAAAAVAAARRSVAAWAALSAVHEVARGRALVGRGLRMLGDVGAAEAELRAAREAFAQVGARPAEEECARLLGTVAVPGGLSPREVEVLRLVAAGLSNAQVADALVLSEKTVARHLSNIFVKLGVGSRTAAGAFAFEHGLV